MIGRTFRRIVVWLLGVPVCHQCGVYGFNCIERCNKTDAERVRAYVNGRS